MCGIFCSIGRRNAVNPSSEHVRSLRNRGPDCLCTRERTSSAQDSKHLQGEAANLLFVSTVLHLRGENIVNQPYSVTGSIDGSEDIFCWNGEAWSIDGDPTTGNDTAVVSRLLQGVTPERINLMARAKLLASGCTRLAHAIGRAAGPYAFIYYHSASGLLFFGRDFLGRRSLLSKVTEEGDFLLSSVADPDDKTGWLEVEANGIYCVDTWQLRPQAPGSDTAKRWGCWAVEMSPYSFQQGRRVSDPKEAPWHSVIPRLSLNVTLTAQPRPLTADAPAVQCLEKLLRQSLAPRILNIPQHRRPHRRVAAAQKPARLAILFSGGLDCTLLARLAHDLYPDQSPIDLLNVAFENPRIHKADSSSNEDIYETCPDRITGRASYAELQRVCPAREWRFVAINIPYVETCSARQAVIDLMYPHNTEMDLSISYALYFAARGEGYLSPTADVKTTYETSARVLLSGLGADELFGGYLRHATAYNREGFKGLLEELDLDIGRLGKRNLGRDDRVISNWGREARYPYLDEQFVQWALAAKITEKCGFGEPAPAKGNDSDESASLEPGKKVLRCLAYKLGVRNVAKEKKRAIQFGARTAKMETRKTKGTQLLG